MQRLKLHHWILIAMALGAAIGLPLNILAERGRFGRRHRAPDSGWR